MTKEQEDELMDEIAKRPAESYAIKAERGAGPELRSTDWLCRIRAKSVMGWPVWVTNVSEPVDTGEGMSPIISMINKREKGKLFSREEAERLLPDVHTAHPEAVIEENAA